MEKLEVLLTLTAKEMGDCAKAVDEAGYFIRDLNGSKPFGIVHTFEHDVDEDLEAMSKEELIKHAKANYIIELRRPAKDTMKEKLGMKKSSNTISRKSVYDQLIAAGIDKDQAVTISGYNG